MDWMLMGWRRYADFSGRSQRMEYWMFLLGTFLVILALGAVWLAAILLLSLNETVIGNRPASIAQLVIFSALGMVTIIFYLAMLIPSIAVTIRRFHDQDLSGWMFLINFVPYIGGFIVFIFMCIDGTSGENRFGEDPKGRDLEEYFD